MKKSNYMSGDKDRDINPEDEYLIIIKEIETSDDIKKNMELEKEDTEYYETDIINCYNLISVKGFLNNNNSCSFDSFLSLFIFSLYPAIIKVFPINDNKDNYI